VVAQALQGGQAGDGDRRGLLEGEVRRLGRELVLRSAGVLGEGALAEAEHLIAGLESGHLVADRFHDPGDVRARDRGLGRAEPVARQAHRVRQAGHEVPHAPVHARRTHAYQYLAGGYLGRTDVPELEHIRRAVGVLDDRFHALPASWRVGPADIGDAFMMQAAEDRDRFGAGREPAGAGQG
jgi:hypothetical protein